MRRNWKRCLRAAADPDGAARRLEQLECLPEAATWLRDATDASVGALGRVLGGSSYFSDLIRAHPEWIVEVFEPAGFQLGRRFEGLEAEVSSWLRPALKAGEFSAALRHLRQFKQREHLRVVARDFARIADVATLTRELSDLADLCLASLLEIVFTQAGSRFGNPWHLEPAGRWRRTPFAVIGLGKLGGQELNHSSDVDVVCVYGEEGHVFRDPPSSRTPVPERGLTNHAFFQRLAAAFIAEVGRVTPEGQLFRIDLRLRPEGEAGPLARSLGSYETYYYQWGQTWERLMLVKARPVAGDPTLGAEFLEVIQPFRYPRSLNPRLFQEIAATKRRMEAEVVEGDLERDVKRGLGGIREVEFVVQSLQLLNGGRQPFLQTPQTLVALPKLQEYGHLIPEEVDHLTVAYQWLREVEHRIQLEHHRQTHALPVSPTGQLRLARLMECRSVREFQRRHHLQRGRVRAIYEKIIARESGDAGPALPDLRDTAAWIGLLRTHQFREPETALKLFERFLHGPGYAHVSNRTEELARQLVPQFLARCPGSPAWSRVPPPERLSDPDRVLARLDSFVTAYGTRAPLYEMWAANLLLFTLLLRVFDRSEHLAGIALKNPDLVEDLLLADRLRLARSAVVTLDDLRHGARDDDQLLWLRQYHQAEQMRIGLRDLLEVGAAADTEQWEATARELTALAEACLQYAVAVVQREQRLKTPPFAVLGLGKLGGSELSFGSDLDLVFVSADRQRNPDRLQKMAGRILELLGQRTEAGMCFACDARLRPDGEKGLLVTSLGAATDYYTRRAKLWELQALSRVRFVAGDATTGGELVARVGRWTDFSAGNPGLAAWSPGWRGEILAMQTRIARERTPPGQESLSFKTGAGGLIEAEFLAQTLSLANGWQEPNTLRSLQSAAAKPGQEALLRVISGYRRLRRLEGVLRRWSFEAESVLPADTAAQLRVARRCGFDHAGELLAWVAAARHEIAGGAAVFHCRQGCAAARPPFNSDGNKRTPLGNRQNS